MMSSLKTQFGVFGRRITSREMFHSCAQPRRPIEGFNSTMSVSSSDADQIHLLSSGGIVRDMIQLPGRSAWGPTITIRRKALHIVYRWTGSGSIRRRSRTASSRRL